MRKIPFILVLVLVLLLAATVSGAAQTEIEFWFSITGKNGEAVEELVEKFNEEQDEIHVDTNFAGSYPQALNQLQMQLEEDEDMPNMIQVYEIGTQIMLDSGATISLTELEEKFSGVDIPDDDFIPVVKERYTFDDELHPLPFANSNPLLYYNKDMFEEAGLDPDDPPETYAELKEAAEKLTVEEDGELEQIGASWAIRSWLVEQLMAVQDQEFANNENGRADTATKLLLDSEAAVNIMELWQGLVEDGHFENPGRAWADARNNFASGLSGMMLQSNAGLSRTLDDIDGEFEMGTAPLPRPEGADEGGVSVSGSALWALKDHSDEELEATGKFMSWLMEKEQQREWHDATGYLPTRLSTIEELEEEGYYEEHPERYTPVKQLLDSPDTPATKGAQVGPHPEVREQVEQAVERIVSDGEDIETSLDRAVEETGQVLQRYNLLQEF